MGTPHCRARSSNPKAISGLVCCIISSGTCACLRRSASWVQDSGKNSWALTGQWNGVLLAGSSARYSALTTTWQLPILLKRAGVLRGDSDRGTPFLGQSCIIKHQDAIGHRMELQQALHARFV